MKQPLLSVKNLKVHFPVKRGKKGQVVHAVDGISFDLYPGETLAMVGESGCGKSTAGRAISRLIEPTSGSVELDGENILDLKGADLKILRSEIQMVFQDPASFFDPRMTVGETLLEPFEIHKLYNKTGRKKRVAHLLQSVGLDESFIDRMPSECSGGQKQRVGIARALALNPKLIIADEPVSALDVLIQAQILNLFQDLKKQFQFSYLFISHDLSVVRQIADRVVVMYLGKIVESAPVDKLFSSPQHPYTQALLAVIPKLAGRTTQSTAVLEGELPSAIDPPSGCSFHTRCPFATERCKTEAPAARVLDKDHLVACHLSEGGQPDVVGA